MTDIAQINNSFIADISTDIINTKYSKSLFRIIQSNDIISFFFKNNNSNDVVYKISLSECDDYYNFTCGYGKSRYISYNNEHSKSTLKSEYVNEKFSFIKNGLDWSLDIIKSLGLLTDDELIVKSLL